MKNIHIILILLLGLLLSACGGSKDVSDSSVEIENKYAFDFVQANSLDRVKQIAQKENKLIFVDVYTSWCLPCRMMDEDVFTHEDTADAINKNFISYKVNAEKSNGPNVAFQYAVTAYPTLLFLDADGNILERKNGVAYHSELLNLAESALFKSKNGEIGD